MPFIRQTRDKRGFEHTYVMHVARPANGAPRTRVLYLFRTPGNLTVGRTPLDGEVMEALEHTHPDLSFDWNTMTREAVVTRAEPTPARQGQGPGPGRGPQRPRPSGQSARAFDQSAVPVDDATLLGATLGGHEAVRLRRRYHDLLHRIGRRARTPEDRVRLLERAKAIDPDRWEDEAAIRAGAPLMEAESDRILAELPSRRRGRRGGRRRPDGVPASSEQSGIMAESDHHHEPDQDSHAEPSTARSADGDDTRHGSADAETDVSLDD